MIVVAAKTRGESMCSEVKENEKTKEELGDKTMLRLRSQSTFMWRFSLSLLAMSSFVMSSKHLAVSGNVMG
jgi:hypothetical protein